MLTEQSDLPTIKHAVRKRIDGLNPSVPNAGQNISTQDIRVRFDRDETKIILCVDIDGVPYVLPAELPTDHIIPYYKVRRDLSHMDLLNAIDRMSEDVKLVAGIQRRQKVMTGEDAPMSQAELDRRVLRTLTYSPFGVIT